MRSLHDENRISKRRVPNNRHAWTLIELLAAVAIIALLISILLPQLSIARHVAQSTVCLSQLRQLAIASHTYMTAHSEFYPPAYYPMKTVNEQTISLNWDFTTTIDWTTEKAVVKPGLLWQGQTDSRVQQCPSISRDAGWGSDPYTGYNYNTSYVGTFQPGRNGKDPILPVRQNQIRRPTGCAIFGDGGLSGFNAERTNKYMRSPRASRDTLESASIREAGVQSYRHLKKTNVTFADGHAEPQAKRFTNMGDYQPNITDDCGFLSEDNSMYWPN
ncbi:MAG: prepilin-type N-terminal cleavage/methylation domain-containing protein [Phycisphaerae bacterium]|nr:prepilin-type N-terminal cleavage/methylation domain-containing protein [Phycisphaerae bacterium]